MKKVLFTLLALCAFSQTHAENYVVLSKLWCNPTFIKLAEQNRRIIEVRNLDMHEYGNILIIYE